jgi:NTE family protein
VDLGLHPTGFLKGDKLESLISGMIGNKAFGDLSIPFALTTTDLETGEEYVHTHGDLRRLVRASCSWPGFFNAVEIDGKLLVDGGVRNPVPTKAACQLGATFVVAVNPGFAVAKQPIDNALKALVQSIQIMGEELTFYQARDADIAIKPDLHEVDQFGFDKAAFLIKQGETACEAALGAIKRKLRFHM